MAPFNYSPVECLWGKVRAVTKPARRFYGNGTLSGEPGTGIVTAAISDNGAPAAALDEQVNVTVTEALAF